MTIERQFARIRTSVRGVGIWPRDLIYWAWYVNDERFDRFCPGGRIR